MLLQLEVQLLPLLHIVPLDKQRRTRRCIKKYNLYFYCSTVTFVWSRNTVRKSSRIYFFCGGRRTHTGELTGLLEWLADAPLRLRDKWIPPLRLRDQGSPPSVQNYRHYIDFSSPMLKYDHPLRLKHFLFMASYRNIHTSVFFFFGNLLILSANGNICHSINMQVIIFSPSSSIFLFPVKPLCSCYLASALNLLSSSTALCHQLS